MYELTTLFFGIVIVCSVFGFGSYALKLFYPESHREIFLIPGLGLAIYICIGGYLNFFHLINSFTETFLLILGIYFFVISALYSPNPIFKQKISKSNLLIYFISFLVVFYVFAIHSLSTNFNSDDDLQGYFAFPAKMNSTGSLGIDPFSERRLVGSLGGQYFLDSFVLKFRGPESLHLIDNGVGFLLFEILILLIMKKRKIRSKIACFALIFIACTNSLSANISSHYTSMIIILTILFLFLNPEKSKRYRFFLLFGLLFGAGMSLKNSNIIFLGMICFWIAVVNIQKIKEVSQLLKIVGLVILGVLIEISPYAISLNTSSGTLLYPILGRGYSGSVYGHFNYAIPFSLVSKSFLHAIYDSTSSVLFLFLFALSLVLIFTEVRLKNRFFVFLTLLSFVTTLVILYLATSGADTVRYMVPFAIPFIVCLIILAIESFTQIAVIVMFFVVILSAVNPFNGTNFSTNSANYVGFLSPKYIHHTTSFQLFQQTIIQMQNSVPRGQKILARTRMNFLFDFKRNPVFIADYPGGASLPPGLPISENSEAVRKYLLSKSIRYVAFSYRNFWSFNQYKERLKSSTPPWIRVEAENTFRFQSELTQLMKRNLLNFDNGSDCVIDLS